MDYSIKDRVTICFILGIIVFGLVLIQETTKADEPCTSREALAHLANVKKNQQGIKETRPGYTTVVTAGKNGEKITGDPEQLVLAYNDFLDFKQWNESESDALAKLGCRVDWETMELVPLERKESFSSSPEKKESTAKFSQETAHAAAPEAPKQSDGKLWAWDGAPDYKNERLAYYQQQLINRGITDKNDLKLLTAQIIQENGSLSADVHGDSGCSVGIIQYNACVHHGVKAKRFLQAHPKWKDWHYQLDQMADMVANRMDIYDGDIKRVIVHHNMPVAAKRGTDTPAGYYRSVSSRTNLLTSL